MDSVRADSFVSSGVNLQAVFAPAPPRKVEKNVLLMLVTSDKLFKENTPKSLYLPGSLKPSRKAWAN